jgi:hypothetical protein
MLHGHSEVVTSFDTTSTATNHELTIAVKVLGEEVWRVRSEVGFANDILVINKNPYLVIVTFRTRLKLE